MPLVTRSRASRTLAATLGLFCLASALGWARAVSASAEPAVSKMFAIYRVHFLGAKLGKFKLWADMGETTYSIRVETNLEMGFIIKDLFFSLKGGAQSDGILENSSPLPRHYALQFVSKRERGRLDMSFAGNAVEKVVADPAMRISPRAVPVTKPHITGVLDPLAAAFLSGLSLRGTTHGAACKQTIAVFDGKHRFDLALSHKKTVRVNRSGKRGYSGTAVVCRIKYAPVAGHTPNNKGLAFFQENDDMEVWLIPVPGTRAYVPYHLSLPTPYGQGAAISTVFEVQTAGNKTISLVQ